jgi:hypothetical protein
MDLPAGLPLSDLVHGVCCKGKTKPAALMDGHGAPPSDLAGKPAKMRGVREALRVLRRTLESSHAGEPFNFVAGAAKDVHGGLHSAFSQRLS